MNLPPSFRLLVPSRFGRGKPRCFPASCFISPFKIFIELLVMILCLAAVPLDARATDEASALPNIVLIMADDIGVEGLSCYGSADYHTPHLDQLALEGLRFANCHSQPLCTPSRAQIMTGQYNVRNYTTFGELAVGQRTFAHDLKEKGYVTAIAGKWQLGGDRRGVKAFGFDEYILWWMERKSWRYGNVGELIRNGETLPGGKGEYGPEVINNFALDYIERHREERFLLYYPMILPHSPFVPTPDSAEASDVDKEDPKYFADMVSYMDKMVGRLVDKLEELELRENTMVIFLGDNGTHSAIATRLQDGSLIRGGKGSVVDASTRVPMIVSWPQRIPQGLVSEALVDFSDFAPTLREAGGISASAGRVLDGHSLMPIFRGEQAGVRDWSYCWYTPNGAEHEPIVSSRDLQYKLYSDGRFYSVPMDPLELQPLAVEDLDTAGQASYRKLKEVIERYERVERIKNLGE